MRNVSLKLKVIGLAVVLLGLVTLQSVLALSGSSSHGLILGVLVAAFALGGGLAYAIIHRLTRGVNRVVGRLDAITEAAKGNLMRGIDALAAGDLTIELEAKTAAESMWTATRSASCCVTPRRSGTR